MRPKFNIPKLDLKITSLRPDSRGCREPYAQDASSPESRPSTPKSVCPPMALDMEAELRAACTYVVTHPKPSHELWAQDAARPALDYAAIKAAEPVPTPAPASAAFPTRKQSLRAKVEARLEAVMHETTVPTSKYSFRPNAHTDELSRQEDATALPSTARSRADLLMAPEPPRHALTSTATHSASHSHSNSQQQVVSPVPIEPAAKVRTSARSDSVGTTGSTPQTDFTDYPGSTSTGITSAVNTPARSSKRASSQNVTSESGNVPKLDPVNAEWMKQELERHKKAIEIREKERERLLEEQHNLLRSGKDHVPVRRVSQPHTMSQVPPRKPVPSKPDGRQARDGSRPCTRQDTPSDQSSSAPNGRGRADPGPTEDTQQTVDQEPRGRIVQRSNSRLRNASRTAKRAVSRAGSITSDIVIHYLRPDSRAATRTSTSPSSRHRSPSRTRQIADNVKEYFKPGTSSRKSSMDAVRDHLRGLSTDSFHSGTSERPGSESGSKSWKGWRSHNKNVGHITPEISRTTSATSGKKPPIDLNRELPPLPSLDSWDEPKVESADKSKPAASMTPALAPAHHGLKRTLSRSDLLSEAARDARRHNLHLAPDNAPQSRKQSTDPANTTVFVGRLTGYVTEDELRSFFQGFGEITYVKIPPSKGCGFVQFVQRHAAEMAINQMQGYPIGNSRVRLSWGGSQHTSGLALTPRMPSGMGPSLDESDLHYLNMTDLSTTRSAESRAKTATVHPVSSRLRSKTSLTSGPDGLRSRLPRNTSDPNCSDHNSDRSGVVLTGNPNLIHHSRAVAAGLVDDPTRAASPSVGMVDDARLMDPRYRNTVEVQEKQAADRERSRRHWWQKQVHKQANWMDEVIKSGAKTGMLVADTTAGSPVVRY